MGAVPVVAGEVVPAREAPDVVDLGQELPGSEMADAVDLEQRGASLVEDLGDLLLQLLHLPREAFQVVEVVQGHLLAGLADGVAWPDSR
jgi:hypothetical protein